MAMHAIQKLEKAKKDKLLEGFSKYSLINPELQSVTFYDYKPMNDTQVTARQVTIDFAKNFEKDHRNLLFTGPYGVGKSHLAKAATDAAINRWFSALFISVPKLMSIIRSSFGKSEESQSDLVMALESTDLLVLDDIGAQKNTDWTDEKLYEIIDGRQGKSTIYTTNLSLDDLYEELGERTYSRIVNRKTVVVEMDGDNYRMLGDV